VRKSSFSVLEKVKIDRNELDIFFNETVPATFNIKKCNSAKETTRMKRKKKLTAKLCDL
jgi:hypothetical protein